MSNKSHKEQTYRTEIGQKATITRSITGGEKARIAHQLLLEIGRNLAGEEFKHYKHLGSVAVHIYQPNVIENELGFVCQVNTLGKTHEVIASMAETELKKRMEEYYRDHIRTNRAGF